MQLLVTQGLGAVVNPTTPIGLPFQVLAVGNHGTHLILTFNNNLNVSGPGLDPAAYRFTGPTSILASHVEVVAPGHLLKVDISDQTAGASYTVELPSQGIMDVNGNIINGPFLHSFVGVGVPTAIQLARAVDARTLDVIFNEPVLQADAILPGKYSITPSLAVLKAERITDQHYRLTTARQTLGESYEVSFTGIRDINGNP